MDVICNRKHSCRAPLRQGMRQKNHHRRRHHHSHHSGCSALNPRYVNVHVIPHSHNDAGWLKSVDEMYDKDVLYIYEGSIEALLQKKERRYVSAENVFFSRWWHAQNNSVQRSVRDLVSSGHLQFVGGGWVQNDEAVTHYTAIIDQMTLGLRFLNDTFGECGRPTVAWQADPFGHSRNQANLFAQMGFDGLMIGRISVDDFDNRFSNRQLVFVWKTDPTESDSGDILTWVPPNTYTTPRYYEYFPSPGDVGFNQWKSDELTTGARVALYSLNLTSTYHGRQIGFLYGSDLSFRFAGHEFLNVDDLVNETNRLGEKYSVHASYSTPYCYVNALHASNETWSVFRGDFFPYTDKVSRTWTGFFTSRPILKHLIRYSNGFLQACKQLSTAAGGSSSAQVRVLQEAVATLQHHDGITGTCTDSVARDYVQMLLNGIRQCEYSMSSSIAFLLNSNTSNSKEVPITFCHQHNISQCPFTEQNKQFTVLVYNPLSRKENVSVRFPVSETNITATDIYGQNVQVQVVPVLKHSTPSTDRKLSAAWELVTVIPVPALGFSALNVTVRRTQSTPRYVLRSRKAPSRRAFRRVVVASSSARHRLQLDSQEDYIENSRYRLVVDRTTGLLSRIHLVDVEKVVRFRQTFGVYLAQEREVPEPAGHYVFATTGARGNLSSNVTFKIVKGPIVEEIHQIHNNYITQVIRLYKDSDAIEFQWTVGPIPHTQYVQSAFGGADVITRYETDLRTAGTFYTDGNGRQNMKRTRRMTRVALPVPSNYYPVVSWISVEDKACGLQLSVIPDRPQGGSSMSDGALELMLHRRHGTADNLGNAESLNEVDENNQGIIVTGKHKVIFGRSEVHVPLVRLESLRSVYMPVLMFAASSQLAKAQTKRSILRGSIPEALHLLTLEPVNNDRVLLRLEHLGIVQDSAWLPISPLLQDFDLEHLQPTTLGGNQYLRNVTSRLRWKVAKQQSGPPARAVERPGEPYYYTAKFFAWRN